jgi:hypothetical protein
MAHRRALHFSRTLIEDRIQESEQTRILKRFKGAETAPLALVMKKPPIVSMLGGFLLFARAGFVL